MSQVSRTTDAGAPIGRLRWWIVGVLFASTAINYIDRQTLGALAPFLKEDYQWTNADYALVVIAFRVAYALGQAAVGRFVDRVGTRRGLAISVGWYSAVAMLTALVALLPGGWAVLAGFMVFRFLLGLGESANWPGATKAVSEWFPRRERAWAVAIFDSGSSIGAAVAPWIVVSLYLALGRQWWPAFVITGLLGFAWLWIWLRLYHPPETHPRIGAAERTMILDDRAAAAAQTGATGARPHWLALLKRRNTWAVIVARATSDPVWYFIADWFMIYLVQERHFELSSTLVVVWIPFLAADLGNLSGGGLSSWLVARGWSLRRARLIVIFAGAAGMMMLIPAIFAQTLVGVVALFAVATFGYAWFCTMALVLPSDLYPGDSVASVSGLGGSFASGVTIAATYVIGDIMTRHSFQPILIAGSIIPLVGALLVAALIRERRSSARV